MASVLRPESFIYTYSYIKDLKYKTLASAAKLDFLPLNSISGRPHDCVRDFIDILSARTAAFRKLPVGAVHFYIVKRLACALQINPCF